MKTWHVGRSTVTEALEAMVRWLQDDIYGLALRMLWNREDAEAATQEILVRVVTRLSQFDGRSALKTWVYRIAVNYILDVKKSAVERMHLSFEMLPQISLPACRPMAPRMLSGRCWPKKRRLAVRSRCFNAWTGHTGWRT